MQGQACDQANVSKDQAILHIIKAMMQSKICQALGL